MLPDNLQYFGYHACGTRVDTKHHHGPDYNPLDLLKTGYAFFMVVECFIVVLKLILCSTTPLTMTMTFTTFGRQRTSTPFRTGH